MPAYNFKGQFAGMVEDGTKPHTIRQRRKRPTKVGDMLHLYTGMRTGACRRLRAPTPCVKVTPIRIMQSAAVYLGGHSLSLTEIRALAHRDGFRGLHPELEFMEFFRATYGESFEGELIEWKS